MRFPVRTRRVWSAVVGGGRKQDVVLQVGIRELKNNLSRLLVRVKAGEEIVVTDRGHPVARIVGEPSAQRPIRKALEPLVEQGLVTLPVRGRRDDVAALEIPEGRPVSEIVLETRR